jgi:hypothetical protein
MSKVIFTAMSKRNFFQKWRIVNFVLKKGEVPLNPFMMFDYFMSDSIEHDIVRNANNTLVERCDELWVFGDIADGVKKEMDMAKRLGKPIKFFDISKLPGGIEEIEENKIIFEE